MSEDTPTGLLRGVPGRSGREEGREEGREDVSCDDWRERYNSQAEVPNAWGVGCEVWGVGCGVWGVGCWVWGVGCGVWVVGCEV